MDLTQYDVILINTSAGKDSLAMLDYVYGMAVDQGVAERVEAVHCDLGRVEWKGTKALAQEQCDKYGVPMYVVSRPQGDLLHQAEFERGKWPDSGNRWCTSDQKRGQVEVLITALTNEFIMENLSAGLNKPGNINSRYKGRPVRILNCMGLRAEESPKRAEKPVLEVNTRVSNGRRTVENWLPIQAWSEVEVWAYIREKGLKYHFAYDLGMPRLSCVFCIFAPPEALLLAGYHNPELLDEYVGAEKRMNHTFKAKLSLVQIQDKLKDGYVPKAVAAEMWPQCA